MSAVQTFFESRQATYSHSAIPRKSAPGGSNAYVLFRAWLWPPERGWVGNPAQQDSAAGVPTSQALHLSAAPLSAEPPFHSSEVFRIISRDGSPRTAHRIPTTTATCGAARLGTARLGSLRYDWWSSSIEIPRCDAITLLSHQTRPGGAAATSCLVAASQCWPRRYSIHGAVISH